VVKARTLGKLSGVVTKIKEMQSSVWEMKDTIDSFEMKLELVGVHERLQNVKGKLLEVMGLIEHG